MVDNKSSTKNNLRLWLHLVVLVGLSTSLGSVIQWSSSFPAQAQSPIERTPVASQHVYVPLIRRGASSPQAVRAIWVQPSAARTPEQADAMISRVKRGGFNTIIYGLYASNVYYRSKLLPQSRSVTSQYDPLAYVVKRGHANGLKVQAWWSSGMAPSYASFRSRYPTYDIALLPTVADDVHSLNFSLPEVRQLVGDVVLELAQNYDIDGIHLDYIRYPDGASGWDGLGDNDVPRTVQNAYQRLKATKPEVQLTAAVVAAQARSRSTRQNWASWLAGDYIDRVFTMAYYDPGETRAFGLAMKAWQGLPHRERIAPGLKVYIGDDVSAAKTPEQIIAQVEACREAGFSDIAAFDEKTITNKILDALAAKYK